MKHSYGGFLGEQGYTGARQRRKKGDLSKIPNSAESRFRGLVFANNGDLSGGKAKKEPKRYTQHICLDIFFMVIAIVLWVIGRKI